MGHYSAPSCDVYTDNNPLIYILTSAKLDATRQRWVAELADYNFKIHYKPERLNGDADTLSRMPLEVEDLQKFCTETCCKEEMVAVVDGITVGKPSFDGLSHCEPTVVEAEEEKGSIGRCTIAALSKKEISRLQDKDPVLDRVKQIVRAGQTPDKKRLKKESVQVRRWLRD